MPWCQKVRHEVQTQKKNRRFVKKYTMTLKVLHDVQNTSCHQKLHYDVKKLVMTAKRTAERQKVRQKVRHDVTKFVMTLKYKGPSS